MKLLTKSTLFFAGFLVLIGVTIFFYTENLTAGAFRKQTTDYFHIIAEQTKNSFLAFVDGTKTEALSWSSGATFQNTAQAVLDAPSGSALRTRRAQEFTDYVKRYKLPFSKSIVLVDLIDKNGIIVASTNAARIGINEGTNEDSAYEFTKAINSQVGEVYTKSIIYEEDEYPEPMIHTMIRLFAPDKQGNFRTIDGVLLLHFSNMDKISKILRGESTTASTTVTHETLLTSYRTSDIYLVNKDHLLVTHARNGATAQMKQTVDTLPVRECLERGGDVNEEYDNYQGVRVFGSSVCFAEDGLVLIIEAGKDELFASLAALTNDILLGGILLLVLGTLTTFFFIRRPLANIDEIVRAARKVATGDLATQAVVRTKDELGDLASVFNHMVASVRDVQKTLRAAKQESEKDRANLKKAQEVARLGSWVIDLKSGQLVWSDEAYRIFGVPPGTPLTYEMFLERVHPDDRAYVDQEWSAALKGKPYDIEHRIFIDHTTKWVRERAELEIDEHGNPFRGSGTVQDITDLKKTENELRVSKERYLAALDSLLEGATIFDHDWRFIYLNDAAARHVRHLKNEVLGRTITEVYPGVETSEMYVALARCMTDRVSQRIETSFTFPDGYVGWYDLLINPVDNGIFVLSIDITEHKRAGETLLRLNTAVQSSGEAIFMTDINGTITFVNPEFTKLYGYMPEEVVGKVTPRILKSGQQLPTYYETFWSKIKRGEVAINELINKNKDGRLITIEESVNPVVEDSGITVGYLAIHRDITERKRIADLTREEEEKFRSIFENSNDAIILLREHEFFDCNKRALEIFGVPSKEVFVKLHPVDISPVLQPDGRNSAIVSQEKIAEAMATGTSRFDWIYKRIDTGTEIPAEVLISAFEYKNERVLQATVRDITERKKAEQSLRDRDEELENINRYLSIEKRDIEKEKAKDEALLASIGEGVIATDETGRIITVNRTAEKLLGWSIEELRGKPLTDAIPATDENDRAISYEERATPRVLKSGDTIFVDALFYGRKNGTKLPIALVVSPVVSEKRIMGVIATFRDITRELELEKTRRDLLSLASHQLRTPLSGTKWLIETLRRGIHGPLTKAQGEYLEEIYKINERMTLLVFDMLNVLRMESGIEPIHRQEVSTSATLRTLIETTGLAAKDRNVSLTLNEDADHVVITDPQILRTILENFVTNAINYSRPGGTVTVSVREEAGCIIFAVADTGIGIPRYEQGQIFARFYRASNAKVFNTRGSGLGLYIASVLAKKIGALLSFDSEEGNGSTFYVHIPLRSKAVESIL